MVDATQVQIRRGTQAECEGMVPVEGEVICDLTNDTLRVGDGSKVGGHLMPNVARMQSGQYMFATAGGTANAITVDLAPAVEFLTVGMEFRFLAVANNTGSVTLALNGISAIDLRKIQSGSPVPLDTNDISSGVIYNVVYDGTYFVLFSGSGGGIVAPVAGDTYAIYEVLSLETTTTSAGAQFDYQDRAGQMWNVRVNVSGSVRVNLRAGMSGPGTSIASVALNGAIEQSWTRGSHGVIARTTDLTVNAGDVISIRNYRSVGSGAAVTSNIRILSDTPAYGAVSG